MIRNPNWLVVALLAVSTHCYATPSTPTKWDVEVFCPTEAGGSDCEEYSSDIEIWTIGDEICGTINQTTERRSPDGWFAGRKRGSQVLVRFVDTFQYREGVFGTAAIRIGKSSLTWTVLTTADGQEIHSETRYRRSSSKIELWEMPDVNSCAELETKMSGTTIHLAPR
jgi:hypothetical protein